MVVGKIKYQESGKGIYLIIGEWFYLIVSLEI